MKKRRIFLLFIAALQVVTIIAQGYRPAVSILGDSYSTFEGFVEPSTNEMWYYARHGGNTDVESVEQTWWWQVVNEMGWRLCKNNSYSGSTIGYTGYDGNDYSARSFLTRMDDLGSPDVIMVFGATNDSWAGEQVGEYKWEGWTKGDFYTFRPAMAFLLHHLKQRYPNTTIYFLLNSELREDISESVLTVCKHFGVPCIALHDIEKLNGHPSVKGMRAIANQVKTAISKP